MLTVSLWGTLSVCAIGILLTATPLYLGVPISVVIVPPLAYLVRRSATISIEADESRVVVRNPYRTYTLMVG